MSRKVKVQSHSSPALVVSMSDTGLVIVLLSSISAPRDRQYTDHTRCVWLWSVCINCVVSIVWKGTESLWAAIYQPERLSFINKLGPPEWACCYNVITIVLSIMGWGRQSACYCIYGPYSTHYVSGAGVFANQDLATPRYLVLLGMVFKMLYLSFWTELFKSVFRPKLFK